MWLNLVGKPFRLDDVHPKFWSEFKPKGLHECALCCKDINQNKPYMAHPVIYNWLNGYWQSVYPQGSVVHVCEACFDEVMGVKRDMITVEEYRKEFKQTVDKLERRIEEIATNYEGTEHMKAKEFLKDVKSAQIRFYVENYNEDKEDDLSDNFYMSLGKYVSKRILAMQLDDIKSKWPGN